MFINEVGGSVAGPIVVDGGADADVFQNLGLAGSIDFSGEDGADVFINTASGIASIDVSGVQTPDGSAMTAPTLARCELFGGSLAGHPITTGEDGPTCS